MRPLQLVDDPLRACLVLQVHLFAADAVQVGGEAAVLLFAALSLLCEQRVDRPVFDRNKSLDLPLALYDEAHGYRLYPAGGQAAAHAVPQQRADLVAHKPVQDAAGLLGVDQVHVDLPGVGEGLVDRPLGDLVEHYPPGAGLLDFRRRHKVPGDGLAFAVRVGGQEDLGRVLDLVFQLFDYLALLVGDPVLRREAVRPRPPTGCERSRSRTWPTDALTR